MTPEVKKKKYIGGKSRVGFDGTIGFFKRWFWRHGKKGLKE